MKGYYMNAQQLLTEWRNIINTENSYADTEDRKSSVNPEFEQLLIIAETQNVCIKAMKKGYDVQQLEKWLVDSNPSLSNKSPLELIETGEVNRVYEII